MYFRKTGWGLHFGPLILLPKRPTDLFLRCAAFFCVAHYSCRGLSHFFFSFFWGFFHKCFFPGEGIGKIWPPVDFKTSLVVDYFSIPLFKTIILLSSGINITLSHHSLINKNYKGFFFGLLSTVLLGILFLCLQNFEYLNSFLRFNTLIFGSCFYILTGFHGLHVIVGTLFLSVCFIRHLNFEFSPAHHFGFEAAAWYWHFVDVVWLFLYLVVYWWGGA